jgi:aspartyl protease family protein
LSKIPTLLFVAAGIALATTTLDERTLGLASNDAGNGPSRPAINHQGPAVTAISAGRLGQFTAETLANDVHVSMMADTGATVVTLTESDAQRIGFDMEWLEFNTPIRTANGTAMAARITLDSLSVGGIEMRDVSAIVVKAGLLEHSLLGMSFLGAISRFEIKGDQMVLYR